MSGCKSLLPCKHSGGTQQPLSSILTVLGQWFSALAVHQNYLETEKSPVCSLYSKSKVIIDNHPHREEWLGCVRDIWFCHLKRQCIKWRHTELYLPQVCFDLENIIAKVALKWNYWRWIIYSRYFWRGQGGRGELTTDCKYRQQHH